jgi:mRNA-degrading endonuclease HigB of HigAB toxin-antitoxin module
MENFKFRIITNKNKNDAEKIIKNKEKNPNIEENFEFRMTDDNKKTFENAMREKKEEDLDLKETLNSVKSHVKEQPASIQQMIERGILAENEFSKITNINNQNFIFSKINGNTVITLVQDKENPNKYKTRIFRFSGSDHQWKSLAGIRLDGSYMKGDEKNPLHHYVQSSKLHKDIYQILENLPQEKSKYEVENFLPREGVNDITRNAPWEEFEFKENIQTLKNKEWASYQKFCQDVYKHYSLFVSAAGTLSCDLNGKLYKSLIALETIQEFKNIKTVLEEANNNNPNNPFLRENRTIFLKKLSKLHYLSNGSSDSSLAAKKIIETYNKNVESYIEKSFITSPPETMIPNFSPKNCIDKYTKEGLKEGDDIIHVEEYEVNSPEGDKLIFAMAYDDKGRVYIDNIYDPRVGINDYGIPEQITQMGFLIYKPDDYISQVEFGFPKKYLKEKNNRKIHTGINASIYTDINALWRNIPIIKKYRDELIARGIIK